MQLSTEVQYDRFLEESFITPLLLFKHSYRCTLSAIVLDRIESHFLLLSKQFWLLDVVQNRELSNFVSRTQSIHHESPQALIIYKGECIWDEDHLDIQTDDIISIMNNIDVND